MHSSRGATSTKIVQMLASGIGEGAGRSAPLLHHDRIHGVVRGRRGARLTALMNGGTIPETGDYQVVAEPDDTVVGSVNEDFAMESMAGDIFLLGSTSWRIRRVHQSTVRVVDAQGAPPTIPFWLGEAPGRTRELSQEVSRLRRDMADGVDDPTTLHARLQQECAVSPSAAAQMIDYVRATRDGLGLVPSDSDVVYERFFDDSGGMQLVVHAPFGQRVNRAWGLALRKRFCVRFDFELQAAANDDAILLSLGPQHSFPLEETFRYVTAGNVARALQQAILLRAAVSDPLALERDARAGGCAPARRSPRAALSAATAIRRSARCRISGASRLSGERHRAARSAGSSADGSNGARLPHRSYGPAGAR